MVSGVEKWISPQLIGESMIFQSEDDPPSLVSVLPGEWGGEPLAGLRITLDRQEMADQVLVCGVDSSESPADILGIRAALLSGALWMFRSGVQPIQPTDSIHQGRPGMSHRSAGGRSSNFFGVSPRVHRRSGIVFMVLGMIILVLTIIPAITEDRFPVLWVPVAILGGGFYSFCRGFALDASRRRALDLLPVLLGAAIIGLAFLAPTQGREFPLAVGGAMILLYGVSWIVSLASGRADHGT